MQGSEQVQDRIGLLERGQPSPSADSGRRGGTANGDDLLVEVSSPFFATLSWFPNPVVLKVFRRDA